MCEWNSDYMDAYIVDDTDSSSGEIKELDLIRQVQMHLKEIQEHMVEPLIYNTQENELAAIFHTQHSNIYRLFLRSFIG